MAATKLRTLLDIIQKISLTYDCDMVLMEPMIFCFSAVCAGLVERS